MKINHYQFGSITIEGEVYPFDVEVRPLEILRWQRKASHIIDAEDVKRAVEQNPELIIIGNGESGVAQVTEDAKKEIEAKKIPFVIKETAEAVEIFNQETEKGKKVIGLFHLTC